MGIVSLENLLVAQQFKNSPFCVGPSTSYPRPRTWAPYYPTLSL